MPKIDVSKVPVFTGSSYPKPHDAQMVGRSQQGIGDAAGLTQFGANLVRLAPGALSSLRHWHERQDEFLVVTEGTLVLVDDDGDTPLVPGDCCAFPAGDGNAHHLVNRSDQDAVFVVVGTRTEAEVGWYADLDMKVTVDSSGMRYTRRDGSALETGTEARPTTFADLSEWLSQALVTGDMSLYRKVFHMPHEIVPRNGKAYMVRTPDELKEDFDLYHAALKGQGITAITRHILSDSTPDSDTRVIEAEVRLMRGDTIAVTPFTTTFRMERREGRWAFSRVISSLGHITWTRGEGGITSDRRFELD